MEKTGRTCKYFLSYFELYDLDPLEPDDIGECHVINTYPIPSEKCGIGWDCSCDKWEKRND